jgi:hypothetical protein
MAETVCKSKGAALAALDTIAETMQRGTPRDVLLAIKKWIDENLRETFLPGDIQAELDRIFQGTEAQQKGRAWIERELSDPAYVGGLPIKGDEGRHYHKMIHEPEHGAELDCYWNSKIKAWEPCHSWPIVTHKTEAHNRGAQRGLSPGMILTDQHIEAIKTAALAVDYGSITIQAGTGDHLDIIVENRLRFPKEPEKPNSRSPLLANKRT